MKYVLILMITLATTVDPAKIARINSYKNAAKKAYIEGDYKTAASKYQYLVDSLQVQEEEVLMNLANSYFKLNDTTRAQTGFQNLSQSKNAHMRSKAEQQLGVMANRQGKTEEALNHFKQALKSDPTNNDARYNYELLKKKLDEEKKKQQQQNKQNQDQQKQDQEKQEQEKKQDQQKQDQEKKDQEKKDQENKEKENQENKDQQNQDQQKKDQEEKDKEQQQKEQQEKEKKEKEGEKKELPPDVAKRLEEMKISEDKARMILEAMKNQEVQYLQQNKRKPTKRRDKGKPDW
jgi:Ca-activated chloride channel family protein